MNGLGDLVATLGVNSSLWSRGLQAAQGDLKAFGNIAQVTLGNIAANAIGRLSSMASGAVSSMFQLAAAAESTQISFGVMLGSGQAAAQMLSQLRSFAAATPLEFGDLQNSARTLLSFGVAADQIMPSLKMLGDVSGGDAERFQRLSLAFAQMSSMGRLMGQDLLQMVNAGFNPLQIISEKTGESLADLKKKMEKGEISSAMVTQAFKDATSAGGKFFGMMDQQSQTMTGLWSTASDNLKLTLQSLGEAFITAFDMKGALRFTGDTLQSISKYLANNREMVAQLAKSFSYAAAAVGILATAMAAYALKTQIAAAATIFMQAAAGPAGWAAIAVGIVAATAAISAMEMALSGAADGARELSRVTETVAVGAATPGGSTASDNWAKRLEESLKTIRDSRSQSDVESLQGKIHGLRGAFAVLYEDARRAGASVYELSRIEFDREKSIWGQIDKAAGFTSRLQAVNNEIRVMKGVATEASIELEKMADNLVPPNKIAELKAAMDELQNLKRMEDDRKAITEREVKNAEIRKRMMDAGNTTPGGVGAAQKGSADAVSAVLRAMRGDPIEKEQLNELQNLNEQFAVVVDHTKAIAEGRGGVMVAAGGLN